MKQQPLEYESQAPPRKPAARRVFGRIALGAWAVAAGAFVFLVFNSSDRSSMQMPAAILASMSFMTAVLLTLFHWLLIIILWAQARKE